MLVLGLALWVGFSRAAPPSPQFRTATPTRESTIFPTMTVDPLTPTSESCFFNWATRTLPLLTERLQADLNAAGLTNVTATANLFGEDCIDYNTNQVRAFGAMQTDIRVTVSLARRADFSNRNLLGNLTAEILVIIQAAP